MLQELINYQKTHSEPYPQSPSMNIEETEIFLNKAQIAVISTLNLDGTIHSSPVWFILKNNEIHFGTQAISQKIVNLKRDSRVTVMIDSHEMPYKGIMIYGEVILDNNNVINKRVEVFSKYMSKEKAKSMVENYANKFEPIYVRIIPTKISSWDYGK